MKSVWWRIFGEFDQVAVTYVDLAANLQNESRAHELLDANERDRASKYVSAAARRRFTLCRAALRIQVSELTGVANSDLSFTAIRNEKPIALVRGRELTCAFNVSHTEDHGLLAFAETGRIGVDIEHRNVRHDIDGELRRVFSPREQDKLASTEEAVKEDLFLKMWTLKEAFIKAIGEGFRADTTTFTIPDSILNNDVDQVVVRFEEFSDAPWKLVSLNDNNFVAAFAHELS